MRGKENKGITLIALVITIIVLLILAGVVIATLTGENGILTKTNQAKRETTRATAEEKVNIAVLGSYGKDGRLNYQELQNNLNEVEGIDKQTIPNPITAESFPFTVTVDGVEVKITADGEVSLLGNLSEWDKTAAKEDCFYWGSNTKGEEGYNTIIGYTSKIQSYTKLRFPSRCTKIEFPYTSDYGDGISSQISRTFTNNIEKVELPNTVVSIGDSAFTSVYNSFQNLKEVIISDSVTSIGNSAFSNCTGLSSIIIPESVISIGNDAFYNCNNLSSITIGDSVTSIGNGAFSNCTGLSSIIIPDSVTTMGECAFLGWTSNQTIKCRASEKPAGWVNEWDYYDYPWSENTQRQAKIEWGYTGE